MAFRSILVKAERCLRRRRITRRRFGERDVVLLSIRLRRLRMIKLITDILIGVVSSFV